MLTLRQVKLTVFLLNREDRVNSNDISERYGIDRKTLRAELNAVGENFGDEIKISSARQGYRIDFISDKAREELVNTIDIYGNNSCLPYRSSEITLYLLFLREYISMQELAERFYMSKTAVALTLQTVKRWIGRSNSIELEISGNRGIRVVADESKKRNFCARFGSLNTFRKIPIEKEIVDRYTEILAAVRRIMPGILKDAGYILTGESYKGLTRYISCSVLRSEMGMPIENNRTGYDKELLTKILKGVLDETGYAIDENESGEIWKIIIQSNYISNSEKINLELKTEVRKKLAELKGKISGVIGENIKFSEKESIYLTEMICQSLKRAQNGIAAVNNQWEDIVKSKPLEVYLMEIFIPEIYAVKLSNEIAMPAQFLHEVLRQIKGKLNVLIVSDLSMACVYPFEKLIRSAAGFEDVKITTLPGYIYKQETEIVKEYDLLLTTEAEILLLNTKFHLLPAVMTKGDREAVRNIVLNAIKEISGNKYAVIEEKYLKEEGIFADKKIEVKENERAYSLRNGLLLLIKISEDAESSIKSYICEQPCDYNHKQIKRILRVSFNKNDGDIFAFFDYVAERIKEFY